MVDAETGPFSLLGYITWKCISCGTWRVPGAPFHKSGEKAVFLTACGFGDTSQMYARTPSGGRALFARCCHYMPGWILSERARPKRCCNCQRNKETIVWHERRLRVHRSVCFPYLHRTPLTQPVAVQNRGDCIRWLYFKGSLGFAGCD